MKNKFLIDTPPTTISGSLHIGHIFSYTQGDIIAQYQKYLGKELIYPFCFDNNGIPTAKLASNRDIKGTKNIIDFSIKRSEEYLDTFNQCGINFSDTTYHTYDSTSIQIAYKAFEYLREKNIAYKADTESLWSEKLNCSISQSELGEDGKIERTGEDPIIKKGIGWFIRIKDFKEEIKNQINQINWKPEKFKLSAINWCDNLKWDWSISRERHYGIPIPGEENLTFDTWFISSLTPQITWSSYNRLSEIRCPIFDMRFQSHDIIRSWTFYTIAMSYFLNSQIPWKTIMITGHTLDGNGNKFSKSSGNATNPLPLIEQYKINGIRHWSSCNTLGTDTKLDFEKMRNGWKITNKFNNAKKFISMQIENNWIGEKDALNEIWDDYKQRILTSFDNYDISFAASLMYEFLWNIFCDKWIEESKISPISLTLKIILEDFEKIFNIIYK